MKQLTGFAKTGLVATFIALTAITSQTANAQTYPDRIVRMISPAPPGSGLDGVGRIAAEQLSKVIGQKVIVENFPSSNLSAGARQAAIAPADGYSLFLQSTALFANLSSMKEPGFSPSTFKQIGGIGYAPYVLIVNNKSSGAKTLKEFVAFGQKNPGKLKLAMGSGQQSALAGQFKILAGGGFDWLEVPFRGGPDAQQALVAGEVDAYWAPPTLFVTVKDQPNMLAIGLTDKTRTSELPDVPTFEESGFAGFVSTTIAGVAVRSETPEPIVSFLRTKWADMMKMPETRAMIEKVKYIPFTGSAADYEASVARDTEMFAADARRRGLEPQ